MSTDTNVHHTNADVSATAGTDADVFPTTPADAYVHRTIDDATALLAEDIANTDAEGHAYPTSTPTSNRRWHLSTGRHLTHARPNPIDTI